MNKRELAAEMTKELGLSRNEAERNVNMLLKLITEALVYGEHVRLNGFGTFSVQDRKARKGSHPITREPIHIPAKRYVRFKDSAAMSDQVNPD